MARGGVVAVSTYDRMMAEIELDSDEESPTRADTKGNERRIKQTKGRIPEPMITKTRNKTIENNLDLAAEAKSSQVSNELFNQEPSRQRRSLDESKSLSLEDDDQDHSDHEREAHVRQIPKETTTFTIPTTLPTGSDSLRGFVTKAPKSSSPAIRCKVVRDRHGRNLLHPIFRLYLDDGTESENQFLLCAQKRSTSKTSNYLLTLEKNPTERHSPSVVAKLRANWSGSEYTIYDDGLSPHKTALESNVRSILAFIDFGYDEMGPGRLNVRIPNVYEHGNAMNKWNDPDLEKESHKKSIFMKMVDQQACGLRNKRPRYDEKLGGHVLDFKGRITMPSIKNFQLQSDMHGEETILQFGRVSCQPPGPRAQCKCHQHTFVMDVKHPLSLVQAFAICLATLDTKVADGKMFESMSKMMIKKK